MRYLAVVLLLCSCASLEEKGGPYLAKGIAKYCETPKDARAALRAEVNKLAAPNAGKVCCAVDGPITACKD
jgi:hypothetical protein